MKKRKPATAQPSTAALMAELAAGPLFPELFADEPYTWHDQIADDSPFRPAAVVQRALPDMPPPDYEHIRRKDAERRRARRRR